MFTALFTFLGGSVFRMLWGEISAWITKGQDHAQEIDRMSLQNDFDAQAHIRAVEMLKVQSELGIKTIEAQAEANVSAVEAQAFDDAMKNAFTPTGISFVDIWNGIIRPAAATIALGLWVAKLHTQNYVMEEWDIALAGTILGFFFASRELSKRGK
jgi:hypothetical protein